MPAFKALDFDPRIERAVKSAVLSFSQTRALNFSDLEDLAQELRIALFLQNSDAETLNAKNLAINWWRNLYGRMRNGKRDQIGKRTVERLWYEPELPDVAMDPPFADSTLIRSVEAALAKLSETDRTLLRMRFLEEAPGKEIARAVGMCESRMYQHMKLAKNRFRRAFKELSQ